MLDSLFGNFKKKRNIEIEREKEVSVKKSKADNRYDVNNISYKIDGYMCSDPQKTREECFNDAKEQLRKLMERELSILERFTYEQYERCKKKDFRP